MTFAYATCQKWEEGFYNAYAHMAEEELDLVVFLGDYTYEYGIDPATGGVRGVELPPEYADETVTLDQFRLRHALYKTDGDLQRAHARFPFVVTWDDHEVDNDYTGDIPEDGTPPEVFRVRRIAGYQAFYEHLPLRAPALPDRRGQSTRTSGSSTATARATSAARSAGTACRPTCATSSAWERRARRSGRSRASSSRTATPARCPPDARPSPQLPLAAGPAGLCLRRVAQPVNLVARRRSLASVTIRSTMIPAGSTASISPAVWPV